MAGHSKWKNIQHRKGAQDKKRAKIFTKILKEVAVAVKTGGGPDSDSNPRLRSVIANAKAVNIPKDTLERAIKKAAGSSSAQLEENNFECYGPHGVAIWVECATDNGTRTVSNVRSYLNRYGGSIGKDGCLQFVFEQKGVFTLKSEGKDIDELTLELIDQGAEEVEVDEEFLIITSAKEDFGNIQKYLANNNFDVEEASLQRIPTTTKSIDKEKYETISKLIDLLEDDDDVINVFHNIEFSEELAQLE